MMEQDIVPIDEITDSSQMNDSQDLRRPTVNLPKNKKISVKDLNVDKRKTYTGNKETKKLTQTSNERIDTDSLELSGTVASIPDAFQLDEPPQKKVGLEAKKI